ncbi:MAG TPA: DUF5681 domain-containing protein [Rhizomicrobium sp.]|nr:DUF5681 domain-containing protein [Rhizomicrobium sp.]
MTSKPLKSQQKPTRTGATVSLHGRGPYRIGYARPPEAYQFKPGQSGNLLGRPTAATRLSRLGLAPLLAEALAEPVMFYVGGKRRRMTRITAMTKTFAAAAAAGDAHAVALLVDLFRDVVEALLLRLPA